MNKQYKDIAKSQRWKLAKNIKGRYRLWYYDHARYIASEISEEELADLAEVVCKARLQSRYPNEPASLTVSWCPSSKRTNSVLRKGEG